MVTKELEKSGAYMFHNDTFKIFSTTDHCAVTAHMAFSYGLTKCTYT